MRPSSILALALLLPLLASPALGAPADDPRPIVPASEILAKIERGEPVEYDGVIVVGDLNLSEVDLPTKHVERTEDEIYWYGLAEDVKIVESSISIIDSEIRGDVNLCNAIFQEPVSFLGTNFTEDAWFSGANFTGHAIFREARFSGGDTSFVMAQFDGDACFKEAQFGKNTNFLEERLSDDETSILMAESSGCYANFGGAQFSGSNTSFAMTQFSDCDANFGGVHFSEGTDFEGVWYNGMLNFEDASADFRKRVQAKEILAEIWRGDPVEYESVIIVGDLNLSGLNLPMKHIERNDKDINEVLSEDVKLVASPIRIMYSEIRGNVDLGNSILQEPISFEGTNFTEGARFLGSIFSGGDAAFWDAVFSGGDANFMDTEFSGDAYFGGAEFSGGDAEFSGAEFGGGDADFWIAEFSGGDAEFSGAEFSGGDANFNEVVFSGGDANFNEVVFSGGDAGFWDAVFSGGGANFMDTEFSGDAYFGGAEFSGSSWFHSKSKPSGSYSWTGKSCWGCACFWGVVFGKDAVFEGAEFSNSSAIFEEAVFSGDADFGNTQFNANADFEGAQFSGIATFEESFFNHTDITLENAKNIRTLRLSKSSFENGSTISLKGTEYERLYVHWDSIEDALVYNGEAYLTLVKNFKAIEYFEDADDCYYQYRRERQSMRSFWEVAKYTDILGWVTCGYGVRPGYTLLLGLFVVFVSAVYYWRRDAIRRLKGDEDESAKFSDAFYFSMMTFTTVGYGDWYPLDRHRNVVMIEGIVGWLTLSLFLVTLANVIIR